MDALPMLDYGQFLADAFFALKVIAGLVWHFTSQDAARGREISEAFVRFEAGFAAVIFEARPRAPDLVTETYDLLRTITAAAPELARDVERLWRPLATFAHVFVAVQAFAQLVPAVRADLDLPAAPFSLSAVLYVNCIGAISRTIDRAIVAPGVPLELVRHARWFSSLLMVWPDSPGRAYDDRSADAALHFRRLMQVTKAVWTPDQMKKLAGSLQHRLLAFASILAASQPFLTVEQWARLEQADALLGEAMAGDLTQQVARFARVKVLCEPLVPADGPAAAPGRDFMLVLDATLRVPTVIHETAVADAAAAELRIQAPPAMGVTISLKSPVFEVPRLLREIVGIVGDGFGEIAEEATRILRYRAGGPEYRASIGALAAVEQTVEAARLAVADAKMRRAEAQESGLERLRDIAGEIREQRVGIERDRELARRKRIQIERLRARCWRPDPESARRYCHAQFLPEVPLPPPPRAGVVRPPEGDEEVAERLRRALEENGRLRAELAALHEGESAEDGRFISERDARMVTSGDFARWLERHRGAEATVNSRLAAFRIASVASLPKATARLLTDLETVMAIGELYGIRNAAFSEKIRWARAVVPEAKSALMKLLEDVEDC
jgi:hypothetical protein